MPLLQSEGGVWRSDPVRAEFPLEAGPVPVPVSVQRSTGTRQGHRVTRKPL